MPINFREHGDVGSVVGGEVVIERVLDAPVVQHHGRQRITPRLRAVTASGDKLARGTAAQDPRGVLHEKSSRVIVGALNFECRGRKTRYPDREVLRVDIGGHFSARGRGLRTGGDLGRRCWAARDSKIHFTGKAISRYRAVFRPGRNVGKHLATYPANLCPFRCGGAASQSRPRKTILPNESGNSKRFCDNRLPASGTPAKRDFSGALR